MEYMLIVMVSINKFIHRHFVLNEFFTGKTFPGHFLILSNSRTFPGPTKRIRYFRGFSECMRTVYSIKT